ncbi:MAG: hypothetical protein ACQET7_12110 [Thermodesulfobacteriota bacterium]
MSIKLVARELYRLERETGDLERRLLKSPHPEREALEDRLRRAKAERNRLRKILEGAKEDPPCRRPG